MAESFSLRELVGSFRPTPGKAADFGFAWFGRFFVILGFAIYTTYQVYFITDRVGIATESVTDVLPDQQHAAAKDLGIFNIANALPQSVAPAIAPFLLAIGGGGNYTLLLLAAAALALLGAALIVPIKAVR